MPVTSETGRLGCTGDRYPTPRPVLRAVRPSAALGSDIPSVSPPSPPPTRESRSLCFRRVSDTLSHYPPEGGSSLGPRSLITAALVNGGDKGSISSRERKEAPRKGPLLPEPEAPEGGTQVTLAPGATGLWREVGSWQYPGDQGEAGREKEGGSGRGS